MGTSLGHGVQPKYIFFTLAIWSFVLGVVAAYYILSTDFLLPSLLPYFRYERQSKVDATADDELTLMKTQCSVCGQRRCPRHRQELNILAFQPWTGLEVRETVDKALDEFLTIVLNEFVYTWYRTLSTDEEFVDELRTSIRFLLSVLLRRAKKVDVPNMVKSKLLRASLQHLHAFLQARKQGRPGEDLQEATLRLLGPNLHYAMQSRKGELEYVRRMVEKLFPFVLRPQALQSRAMCALLREILAASVIMPAMDAVANPDMVNNIILVFLDPNPAPPPPEVPSPLVPFLASFSNQKLPSLGDPDLPPKISKSSLRFVLVDVMDVDCPKMLYPFMQFLKGEAAVNVLQFALSCEDFNKKILDPELSQQDLVRLHSDVCDLYRNYLAPSAPDRISFEDSIVSEMQEIVTGDPEDVIKLRRSTPMFRAYEHVYNLLNHTFLPLFHQSAEYYTMICGERLASQMSRSTPNPVKKGKTLSVLGSKISKVFKPSDTRSLNSLDMLGIENTEDADTVTVVSTSSLDDEVSVSDLDAALDHDLSTWRVTIPRLGARPDPENPKKQFFVFIVEIRRVDIPNVQAKEVWSVARKYQEFYILEQKLKEFHGEMEDCSLPEKKMFGTNKYEFIDGKRDALEQYIQKLLTLPYLKGSQLLYTFLTSDKAFDFGLDINIGRALNKIPGKLVKEKGKHLESFLQSFEKSIEAKAPTPGKRERRDSETSQLSNSSLKLCHSMYENNANGLDLRDSPPGSLLADQKHVEGIYDTLIYIARNVYCVPVWLHHVLYTARMFVKETLEGYLDWYIDHKVTMVTQEHRLVSLVHLLRDVLFYDTSPPRMDDEKTARFQETLTSCLNFLPKAAVLAMGDELHQAGTQTILNCLQQPKLNKQLSYAFLDIVILELFPEVSTDTPTSP
ncbi:sorting nexin-14-like isoform X2 [Dreissena polymorpha]|uniref:sorting nexin-14-like isoform X2 n=1 Tax=Dreissena polymorpha TaxID=45954 RepID=UPI0022643F73|nr:sorting nexin-14-like isoform X2 [Dreissena polymorpha]